MSGSQRCQLTVPCVALVDARRSAVSAPSTVGPRPHVERPRISTGCAPSGPAACRILRERARYRIARLFVQSHDARRQLRPIFFGYPFDVDLSGIEAAGSLQEMSRPTRLRRLGDQIRATSVPLARRFFLSRRPTLEVARGQYFRGSLVRVTLEARVTLVPAMRFVASRTLDRIHLLDGRCLEGLGIHRKTCVNHFSGRRALDQYAVHTFLDPI
jgi:hypothetical protein